MTEIIKLEDQKLQEKLEEAKKSSGEQRFYFLKLSEDFFKDKRIKMIKKWAGGYEYLTLYMEMMTLSLRHGGFIVKEGYMDDFISQLELDLDGYNRETIASGLVLFLRFGLIETDRETYCEMLQVQELTLSEAKRTAEKREYRKKKAQKKEIEENFEKLWKLYPKKKGKGQVSDRKKKEIYEEVGFENFKKAIERYTNEITAKGTPEQYIQMGSTFFNSGHIDYLDENYEAPRGVQALQAPQAPPAENTQRSWQAIENILTIDGVFSMNGLQKEKFNKSKFSELELQKIYEEYPELK